MNRRIAFFASPKAFTGRISLIQRNAIVSWTKLNPRPEIFLMGNEPGVAEIAAELGLRHFPEVECNKIGTPTVNGLFNLAQENSSADWLAYINSDILLLSDFSRALSVLETEVSKNKLNGFLLSSQRIDLSVENAIEFRSPDWEENLRELAQKTGARMNKDAIDLFVFSRDLYKNLLPLTLGRTCWDNYLVWKAREEGGAIIDASDAFILLHQSHDYAHAGGWQNTWHGAEAKENQALTKGKVLSISEACTHLLDKKELKRGQLRNDFNHAELALQRIGVAQKEIDRKNLSAAKDYLEDASQWVLGLQKKCSQLENELHAWKEQGNSACGGEAGVSGKTEEIDFRISRCQFLAATGAIVFNGSCVSLSEHPLLGIRLSTCGCFKKRVQQADLLSSEREANPTSVDFSASAKLCRGWNLVNLEAVVDGKWKSFFCAWKYRPFFRS